jgi:hypothetical protein
MARGILRDHQGTSPEDRRKFDGWLKANAILSLIIAVGILAMALAGLISVGRPDAAITASPKSSNSVASHPSPSHPAFNQVLWK